MVHEVREVQEVGQVEAHGVREGQEVDQVEVQEVRGEGQVEAREVRAEVRVEQNVEAQGGQEVFPPCPAGRGTSWQSNCERA